MVEKNGIICYLTGGEDELVIGQICLITEDLCFLHVKFLCNPQKPEEMIVYCHSCNSLNNTFLLSAYEAFSVRAQYDKG